MASLIRRLSQGSVRRHSSPANTNVSALKTPTPTLPPSPDLQHLNPDELRVLGDVFNRLEQFEEVETARISQLRHELGRLEDHMRRETVLRGSIRHVDLRLCRLCFRNKFADGVGRACAECQRRVCNQCGSFTKLSWNSKRKKNVKGRWQCLFCQKKRELACASGVWFHGGLGQPALNSTVFKRKASDVGVTSDWGCSADVEQSDSSHQHRSMGHKTDSELGCLLREDSLRSGRRAGLRRRLTSGSTDETADLADDEDLDVDDEQFMLERQRCRQERLQMQHRKSRRKHNRRLSVGTCTREDGILPEPPALCPKHGTNTLTVQRELKPNTIKCKSSSQLDTRNNKDWRSSQESLKERDKGMLHPRVRELTVASLRKLSAPARTNINEEQMIMMLNHGSTESIPGHKNIYGLGNSSARNRSHSVPMNRQFRRSSSEGDKLELESFKGRRLVEHAQVHREQPSTDKEFTSRRSKVYVETNSGSPSKTHSRSRRHTSSRSAGTSTAGGLVLSQDSLVPGHKFPPNTLCDRSHLLSPKQSKFVSRRSASDFLFPSVAMPEYRRRSSGRVVSSKYQYSSLENVQKVEQHHLKVPSKHALEVDVTSDNTAHSKGKRGSEESQDELSGRRTSDTPSVCTPDTDVGSTCSKRSCLRRSSSSYRFRIVLQRDPKDASRRTLGLGMRVVGGKQGPDGKLGAFVTWVVRGGPADMGGIVEGDQILEWNGRSLVDATFEEVQQTVGSTSDNVQLIIMHTRMELEKRPSDCYKPPPHWRNRMAAEKPRGSISETKDSASHGTDSPIDSAAQCSLQNDKQLTVMVDRDSNSLSHDARRVGGRIQLKLFHDTRVNCLIFTLMQAQDLTPRPGVEKEMPSAFAKLQLASDKEISQVYKTEAAKNSKNPEWMKMIEITDCDQNKIANTTLLVTVWDCVPKQNDVFLGEVLLDLKTEDLQNKATWYPLHDHDENTGQLPPPTPKLPKRYTGSMKFGEEPDAVEECADSRSDLALVTSPDEKSVTKHTRVRTIGILKRRVSEVAMKVGAILVDKRCNITDKALPSPESPGSLSVRHSASLLSSGIRKESIGKKDQRRLSGQLVSSFLLGRSLSRTNSQSSNTGGNTTTDVDDDTMDSSLRPAPEGDDITSMLGPGQVPPKPSLEKLVNGDIKLSFVITKGQLEVDVICGKGFGLTSANQAPDTYVKTYLVGSGKRLQKRKTKTIRACTDPLFRQKLKYSASNVHGRYIQILIKEKTTGFDRNSCLGEVVVKLDQLELSSHTIGWYKLFKESAVELGSCESLNW